MTANQIAWHRASEEARHNRMVEAETQRSNLRREDETERSNLANELIKHRTLGETFRHNVRTESQNQYANRTARLAQEETKRSNLAKEAETVRSNEAKEKETHRANVAREEETHRANVAGETETNRANKAREEETNRHNLATENIDVYKATSQAKYWEDNIKLGYASNASRERIANTQAAATRYAADTSASATKYASDNQRFTNVMKLQDDYAIRKEQLSQGWTQLGIDQQKANAQTKDADTREFSANTDRYRYNDEHSLMDMREWSMFAETEKDLSMSSYYTGKGATDLMGSFTKVSGSKRGK